MRQQVEIEMVGGHTPAPARRRESREGSKPRILIAEDDLEMRRLLVSALGRAGFRVQAVKDGLELREVLEAAVTDGRGAPELLLSDVQMPGWTGLSALEWVRRQLPELRVLLITAFGDDVTHRRARELGAAGLLDKPFDLVMLRQRIDEIMAEARVSE